MVASTLEKLPETKSFTGLIHLREELTKQAKNQERLAEFQVTIDEAIKDGDKKGVIEFTENEWRDMITNENLPPLERVKKSLKDKIEGMKKVTTETKERTGGIMGELQNKAEEAKKAVEEVKDRAQGAIKEALSPIQKIKENFTKLGNSISEIWSNIWTPIKFAWYTLWATLGFKFGRDALASMTKEKAEKVVEEAKKKAGEIAGKGDEEGKEKTSEKTEKSGSLLDTLSKTLLGSGAIQGLLKAMPKGLRDKLGNPSDGKNFFIRCAKSRALKLLGFSGLTCFGVGKLIETSENPEVIAKIGKMPEGIQEQKEWLKKAAKMTDMGPDAEQATEKLMSAQNEDEVMKLDEASEEDENMVPLKDHPFWSESVEKMKKFGDRLSELYAADKNKFENSLGAAGVIKPGLLGTFAGMAAKSGGIGIWVIQNMVSHLGSTALLAGTIGYSGHLLANKVKVPRDMGPEDLVEKIEDLLTFPEIEQQFKDLGGNIDSPQIKESLSKMGEFTAEISTWTLEKIEEVLYEGASEFLIRRDREKITRADENGLFLLRTKLGHHENDSDLLSKDGKKGVIVDLIEKVKTTNMLTEGDIRRLMEASEGTGIAIFPAGNDKNSETIQWRDVNAGGAPYNLCINPLLSVEKRAEIALEFEPDYLSKKGISGFLRDATGEGIENSKEIFSDMVRILKDGLKDSTEAKTILDKFIATGGIVTGLVGEVIIEDYLGNVARIGGKGIEFLIDMLPGGDDVFQSEALVEMGGVLVPVLFIQSRKIKGNIKQYGFTKGLLKTVVCDTLGSPVRWTARGLKGTRVIWNRYKAGDLAGILRDPAIQIRDRGIAKVQRKIGKLLVHRGGYNTIENFGKHIECLGEIRHISSRLRAIKIIQDFGNKADPRIDKLLHEVRVELRHPEFDDVRDMLHITDIENQVRADNLDVLLKKLDIHYGKIRFGLEAERKEAQRLLQESIKKDPDLVNKALHNTRELRAAHHAHMDINTPEGKKAAQDALDEAEKDWKALNAEKTKIEKELLNAKKQMELHPGDMNLKSIYDIKNKAYIQMFEDYHIKSISLNEIRNAMHELLHGRKPRINLGESHLRSIKGLRGSAKVLGILAVTVGAGFGIEKVAEYIHGDSHENKKEKIETSEDDDKYFGFKKSEGASAEKKEKGIDTCETPEEFNKRLEMVETQYTESTSKFLDPEWVQNISSEEREKVIQEAADGHMLRVDAIKSLIRANKGMMEGFWNKQFTNEETGEEIIPNDIREQGVKAFMFIHKKGGKLTLDSMSHQDMKNVLYLLYDQNYKNALERNLGSGGATAVDLSLRVAPFTGSFMDGKDAYGSFSRGNIGDGLWSTAWCIGGLILDVGGVVSMGGTTAAGSALRAGKVAKTAGRALLHNGVQFGVQFGTSLAKVPRSESTKIDNL